MDKWLIFDANNLAYRAFYAIPQLTHEGVQTAMAYGVFRDIIRCQDEHGTRNIAFCFDHGKSRRALVYPAYKNTRASSGDVDADAAKVELQRQIRRLATLYLPAIGFRNIFHQKGYEADDLIAHLAVIALPRDATAVIVSNDHDLYQLLSSRVSIWDPRKKKLITEKTFTQEYGVAPTQWADVKAIAGCKSDEIAGIVGVGEKTAIKYLRGELPSHVKTHKAIVKGDSIWRRNLSLTRLPYSGVRPLELVPDEVTPSKWRCTLKRLGIKSLRDLA